MATRFEIALPGSKVSALRAAAEEAFDEIELWESLLSIYRPTSDLARLNALGAHQTVRVDPRSFEFLKIARELSASTAGAFDITSAPLVEAWGFLGRAGAMPDPVRLQAARECVGWHHVFLDETNVRVRFDRPGVKLDPGGIGKGYALDHAVTRLRDSGVVNALIHGGTSSVFAMGHPPDADAWAIALPTACGKPNRECVHTEQLRDQSLSVSAVWGKSFTEEGLVRGHVIDPRTGQPVSHATMAMVVSPTATQSDALSTALLVLGSVGMAGLRHEFASARFHVV